MAEKFIFHYPFKLENKIQLRTPVQVFIFQYYGLRTVKLIQNWKLNKPRRESLRRKIKGIIIDQICGWSFD